MPLTAGTVGLPNVGKSTLFNTIAKAGAGMANYPLATTEPDVGMVEVPDPRLARIDELTPAKKIVHITFEFTDTAGLVKGASKGEGPGNKFLKNIRRIDAIIHVVRSFDDDNITSVTGKVDPEEDINTTNLELVIADLNAINRRIGKIEKLAKGNDKDAKTELAILQKIKPVLEGGKAVRSIDLKDDEKKIVKGLFLLISKPVIYMANIVEDSMADPENDKYFRIVKKHTKSEDAGAIVISATTEEEIAGLDDDEKQESSEAEGVTESGLDRLIKAAYHLLELRTFFAAGGPEIHAWTFHEGMKALQIAGVIHSDFERGFIHAEIVSFDDLDKYESMQKVKEASHLRLEGKDYVVQDGDIIEFRPNV